MSRSAFFSLQRLARVAPDLETVPENRRSKSHLRRPLQAGGIAPCDPDLPDGLFQSGPSLQLPIPPKRAFGATKGTWGLDRQV